MWVDLIQDEEEYVCMWVDLIQDEEEYVCMRVDLIQDEAGVCMYVGGFNTR